MVWFKKMKKTCTIKHIDVITAFVSLCSDLIAVVVHGHQTQEMVHVAALSQFADQLGFDAFVAQHSLVSGRGGQSFHADGAVLTDINSE